MKILKHGKKKKPLRGTCDECGCKVECFDTEAEWMDDQRDGSGYYVHCPECESEYLWLR